MCLYGRSTTASVADDAPTTARDRFGGQKAISSDMFFERGSYDPATVTEGRTRLAQFQGATSISSNQYFGREEEEALSQTSDGGMLGDGSLAGLENAARDAVSRIIANPDVQNLGESIRSGALKVCHCFLCVARVLPLTTLGFFLLALGLFSPDVRALVRDSWEALEMVHTGATRESYSYSRYLTWHLWSCVA
jgi:hypothetical protein